MSRAIAALTTSEPQASHLVGVGLRHLHYQDALHGTSAIDFVEIHAENFFSHGGITQTVLGEIQEQYPISLHATSMGLGSAAPIKTSYLTQLKKLVEQINPALVSDHACFTWSYQKGVDVHAGDLLPLEFTPASLAVLSENIDRVQQILGRQILVENISSYISLQQDGMSETEFLVTLAERTQCGLLVDLNNILVNASNKINGDFSSNASTTPMAIARQWLDDIPQHLVKELHLAGYTPVSPPEIIIDDHSQPVSEQCWELYQHAIERYGPVHSLIEWDNALPPWQTLLDQAAKARAIINKVTRTQRGIIA